MTILITRWRLMALAVATIALGVLGWNAAIRWSGRRQSVQAAVEPTRPAAGREARSSAPPALASPASTGGAESKNSSQSRRAEERHLFPGGSLSALIAMGDLETAQEQLSGTSSLEKDADGAPPALLLAAEWGDQAAPLIRSLLEKGADPQASSNGLNAAHVAARSGGLVVLRVLRTAGVNMHALAGDLGTPLTLAASEGQADVVRELVGADGDDLRPPLRRTALARAARSGHAEVVKLLLESGEGLTEPGKVAALVEACTGGSAEAAALLLDAHVQPNARAPDGTTPLHAAAEAGAEPVVRLLLERGARVEEPGPDGETPLVNAARHGHDAIVDLLLERGARVPADPVRRALLSHAERQPDGHLKVVRPGLTQGGWDGPVWFGYAGLELWLPPSVFVNPRLPDWNGQVLAQTHGLVEGDEVGTIQANVLGRAHLGSLVAPEPRTGRSRYYVGVVDPSGSFRADLLVHPEFLRDAESFRGEERSHGQVPGCQREPPPPGVPTRTGGCSVSEFETRSGTTTIELLELDGGISWLRVIVAGTAIPWMRLDPIANGLTLAAYVQGRAGAADRIVLQGTKELQDTLVVFRISAGPSLEQGRVWSYPPPQSGLGARLTAR